MFDQRVRFRIVAVKIVVPADRGRVDEPLDDVRMILDQICARLDRRGVGPPSVVGEQEDVGLEMTFALDGERLGGHVALLN